MTQTERGNLSPQLSMGRCVYVVRLGRKRDAAWKASSPPPTQAEVLIAAPHSQEHIDVAQST